MAKFKTPNESMKRWLASAEFREAYTREKFVHEIARTIRGMRESAGLSQQELADAVGTTQSSIARLELGQGQHAPRWDTLERIARALGKQLKLRFVEPVEGDSSSVEVAGKPAKARRRRGAADRHAG